MKLYQKESTNSIFSKFVPGMFYYAGKIQEMYPFIVILLPKGHRSNTYHWVDVTSNLLNGWNAFDSNNNLIDYGSDSVFYQFDTAKEMYVWIASQL